MNIILFLSVVLSLLVTIIVLPKWIKKAKQIGLLWNDMNKYNKRQVAGSGGVVVVGAFILGVLSYVAIRIFILDIDTSTIEIFALLTTITLAAFIGLVDDILGWVRGGLSPRSRILMTIIAAIPLMVINAGYSSINLPFMGLTNVGILYALIFIPVGIVGAVTTYNFLAGFNGLESSQGIIILLFLSFVAYLTGSSWIALIGLCMVASLLIFYFYNKIPAKVFPGDVLTYSIGGLIACMAILGNFEKIAVFIFIPYIIETVLKVRGRLKKQSFGIPQRDGSLEMPYKKIYGLEHWAIKIIKKIKGKAYEKDVVYLINAIQIIICLLALIIFKESLFI